MKTFHGLSIEEAEALCDLLDEGNIVINSIFCNIDMSSLMSISFCYQLKKINKLTENKPTGTLIINNIF